jgi:hypothetical protein
MGKGILQLCWQHSWQRFYENNKYVWILNNLKNWDDSGAFENFQNAKSASRQDHPSRGKK